MRSARGPGEARRSRLPTAKSPYKVSGELVGIRIRYVSDMYQAKELAYVTVTG